MKTKFPDIDIYNMELFESFWVNDGCYITDCLRVPGGWIFTNFTNNYHLLSSVFVPYHNEFQI